MIFHIYSALLYIFSIFFFPYMAVKLFLKGKARAGLCQRMGFLWDEYGNKDEKAVWVHAVSVGETLAAVPLMRALKEAHPELLIYFSTVTETGNRVAVENIGSIARIFFFPFDFPGAVRRVVSKLRPSLFVVVETEIWPNLLNALNGMGIPAVMVNGRISPRSFKGYARFRFFFRRVLPLMSRFMMQSALDAERITYLGAPPERVFVAGNIKFDQAAQSFGGAGKPAATRAALGIPDGAKVFIAGSTHQGEEDEALKAYRKLLAEFPDMVMVLAPRHPERFAAAEDEVRRTGFQCVRRTAVGKGRVEVVLLLDTMGELAGTYAVGDINFVGGSWAQVGGHNVLEPASFGKPVFFGPVMHNFLDISRMLKDCGAGIEVRDGEELASEAIKLLRDPARYNALGQAALEAIEKNKGALARDLKAVEEMLGVTPP